MSLLDDVAAATGRAVRALTPVSGGDLNEAYRADFGDGGAAFVKTRTDATQAEYEIEAAGLRWLARPYALAVPEVLAVGGAFLVLEWIDHRGSVDDALLGHGLALLHRSGAEVHGCPPPGAPAGDLRLGPLVLPAATGDRWAPFYAEHRLAPLVANARDNGALDAEGAATVERVCARIGELAGPDEPPARLHGDLWSGNVMSGPQGPVLVDPAAYGGHREVDLAMLQLFGSPSPAFFVAYEEFHPLADGYQERTGVWQLFPLLVHAVLFGGGYGQQVARTAARYA